MRFIQFFIISILLVSCGPKKSFYQVGVASWYGKEFHQKPTANGEIYDMYEVSAAHRTAPLGTYAIVTNLENGKRIKVRINDRGPYVDNRIIDLSYGAAKKIGMANKGIANVSVQLFPEKDVHHTAKRLFQDTYYVQVASFFTEATAKRVAEKMREKYENTRVDRTINPNRTEVFRIWIGPLEKKDLAVALKEQLIKTGYKPLIVTE